MTSAITVCWCKHLSANNRSVCEFTKLFAVNPPDILTERSLWVLAVGNFVPVFQTIILGDVYVGVKTNRFVRSLQFQSTFAARKFRWSACQYHVTWRTMQFRTTFIQFLNNVPEFVDPDPCKNEVAQPTKARNAKLERITRPMNGKSKQWNEYDVVYLNTLLLKPSRSACQ